MAKTFRLLTLFALAFYTNLALARPEPTGWMDRAQSCMQALMDSFRFTQEQKLSARRVSDPDLRSFLERKNWQLRLAQEEGGTGNGFHQLLGLSTRSRNRNLPVLSFFTENSTTSLDEHPDLGIYSSELSRSLRAPRRSLVALVESSEIFNPVRSRQLSLNVDFLSLRFHNLAQTYEVLNHHQPIEFKIHRFQDIVADGALKRHWLAIETVGVKDPELRFRIELRLLSLIAEDLDFARPDLHSSHVPITPL